MERRRSATWRRWEEVDHLFAEALERPPPERDFYLERVCENDPELLREVKALLEASGDAAARLSGPGHSLLRAALSGPDGEDAPPPALRPGERVGNYRVVREIGRGGMATVYLADRADGAFEQQVAVKVLRRGLDTEQVVRRFLAERRILSGLVHPHIARLLDGGATEDGLPYLVMEWVDGEPITAWADRRRLGVRDRLRLFLQVAEAVQFAHRRLVIHRDLKPSNVLVDADGKVKLLDFGIAKLLAAEEDDDDPLALTRGGLLPLTPEYASPEQLRGEVVTTASDVFQLGELLYLLVTGRRPLAHRGVLAARPQEVVRPSDIVRAEPARDARLGRGSRASEWAQGCATVRRTTPDGLRRVLRGDVDTIVLKAMRPEPERRYGSAEALADDLRNHLEGRPIAARPAGILYRFGKFSRRNRWFVPTAVVLLLALAGYVGTLVVHSRALERERNAARAEAQRAERVMQFMATLLEASDPNATGGEPLTALDMLDVGVRRAARELADLPLAQAEVLGTVGVLYLRRGRYSRAQPLLERAVALRREAGGDPAALVMELRHLARVVAARKDRDRAILLLEEATTLAERALGPDHTVLAAALTDLAERLELSDAPNAIQRSRALVERAITILRAQEGDVREELARALHVSAVGRGLDGLPQLQEALALRRALYGDNHTLVAATLNDMALALEASDPAAADTLLEQAVEINLRIHGPEHAQTLTLLNNLAGRWRDQGNYARAEPLYREVLRRRREAYPGDSLALAYPLHGLGWVLTELGRPDEAEILLRRMLRFLTAAGEDLESGRYQVGRNTLGRAIAEQGRYAEAEPLLRDSYEWSLANMPSSSYLPVMRARLVDLYEAWGKPGMAARYRKGNPTSRDGSSVP